MSQQWHTIRATPSRESETSSDDDECKGGASFCPKSRHEMAACLCRFYTRLRMTIAMTNNDI
ncbi:MAG: hypothetical protein IJO11_08335 [Alphaproteobacteria bacterium]|nr:hypothetical protein [Alphaproteobacteria bacterium]MBQ6855423.1 hypothetical protein [Alphaproteobacteria bacterium]